MRFQRSAASLSLAALSLIFSAIPSLAGRDCEQTPVGPAENVALFTNYAPEAGGINGNPNRSSSGLAARRHYLEDYLAGRARAVMGAVPQVGGTSHLYGSKYRAITIEKKIGSAKCITVIAADRYGPSSNGKSKMDIVTREARSDTISKFVNEGGQLLPLGREESIPMPKRKMSRDPAATSKLTRPASEKGKK